jgi:hypothetical protein
MKYEITDIQHPAFCFSYRIRSLTDFNDVRKGDLGGYVASEYNLSHNGNCWIYEDALVSEKAWVSGDAKVFNNAIVSGYARVAGDVEVYGEAWAYGNAKVCGNIKIFNLHINFEVSSLKDLKNHLPPLEYITYLKELKKHSLKELIK